MSIFQDDVATILGDYREPMFPAPPMIGVTNTRPACGHVITNPVTQLEVTMLDDEGRRMTPWHLVPCQVQPGAYVPGVDVYRTDGPSLRSFLYQAWAPDGRDLMYVGTTKHSLHLPRFGVHPGPRDDLPTFPQQFPTGTRLPVKLPEPTRCLRSKTPPNKARGVRD